MRVYSKLIRLRNKCLRAVVALPLLTSLSIAATAGKKCELPSYTISSEQYPFLAFSSGHEMLDKMYDDLCVKSSCAFADRADFYKTLSKFVSIEYAFENRDVQCPHTTEVCAKVPVWKKFTRKITIDGQDLVNSISSELQRLSYGGCDYLNVSTNPPEIGDKTLTIRGAYEGKDRFCDNLLGTHDIGKSKGKYYVRATMNAFQNSFPYPLGLENLPERDFSFEFDHAVYDQKNTFLVIFDTKTFLGNLVRRLLTFPFDFTTRLFTDKKTTSDYLRDIKNLASRVDIGKIGKYLSQGVAQLPSIPTDTPDLFPDGGSATFPFALSAADTVFSRGANGNFVVTLNYAKAVPDIAQYVEAERDAQCNAIKIIDSLPNKSKKYVIQKGDRLEKISLSEYGSKNLVHYLRQRNDLASIDRLSIGDNLELPPLWQVSRDVGVNKLILWKENFYARLISEGYDPRMAMKIVREKQLSDLVYPLDFQMREILEQYPMNKAE